MAFYHHHKLICKITLSQTILNPCGDDDELALCLFWKIGVCQNLPRDALKVISVRTGRYQLILPLHIVSYSWLIIRISCIVPNKQSKHFPSIFRWRKILAGSWGAVLSFGELSFLYKPVIKLSLIGSGEGDLISSGLDQILISNHPNFSWLGGRFPSFKDLIGKGKYNKVCKRSLVRAARTPQPTTNQPGH